MSDLISRQDAVDEVQAIEYLATLRDGDVVVRMNDVEHILYTMSSAKPETKPIDYRDCANAMMKMWIDNVLTDGEYNRIMDKLNKYWKKGTSNE